MRLDISVADSLGVDVGQRPEQLVDVKLNFEDWHGGLHLVEESRRSIHRLGHEFLYQVQVDFILLHILLACAVSTLRGPAAYPLAIAVVESLQLDDVGMSDNAHDLKLTILVLQLVCVQRYQIDVRCWCLP